MQNHLDDQAVLVDALDRWFSILRKRLGAPVPLKPAPRSAIEKLGEACGVTVPPDVVTLYEYTNGAWLDDNSMLGHRWLPNQLAFNPLPPVGPATYCWHWELVGLDLVGGAYDQLPNREWDAAVPVFEASSGEQVAVMAASRCFQAVSHIGSDGMHWVGRRLSSLLEAAILLDEQGLLSWSPSRLGYAQGIFRRTPAHPQQLGRPYQGWIWEELGESFERANTQENDAEPSR